MHHNSHQDSQMLDPIYLNNQLLICFALTISYITLVIVKNNLTVKKI